MQTVQAFRNHKKKVFVVYPGGNIKKVRGIEKAEVLLAMKYKAVEQYAQKCPEKSSAIPTNQMLTIEIN
jgi:hypothetical protein